jgi:acetyltransferase-like isoleucine patch superfamily enzyme
MNDGAFRGSLNRTFQILARILPGGETLRVMLHRARGVHIGQDVFISQDVILETAYPHLITIEDRAWIGIRVTIIAHMRELSRGVTIEHDAFVGPGAIILPDVTIGHGAVVTAGSVVTRSVPPMMVVQGNPAAPVARCGVPLTQETTIKEFSRRLKPLAAGRHGVTAPPERQQNKVPMNSL